jgi:site-specific recombinase XerD
MNKLNSENERIKRLDLPGSLHWLRHTFCTHHVLAGTPIRAVQQLAGHSTIAVTERYCHVLNELGKFGENVSFGEKKFG